jgi:hypothetical protein
MQLELFPWEVLTLQDKAQIFGDIRRAYWHIRNLRGGRFGQAARRRHYRNVAAQKKRLQLAGVGKREILDFLACCRLKCSARKQPFKPCRYCRD